MRTTLFCLALCTGLVLAGPTSAQGTPAAAACKSTVSGDLRLHALKVDLRQRADDPRAAASGL